MVRVLLARFFFLGLLPGIFSTEGAFVSRHPQERGQPLRVWESILGVDGGYCYIYRVMLIPLLRLFTAGIILAHLF